MENMEGMRGGGGGGREGRRCKVDGGDEMEPHVVTRVWEGGGKEGMKGCHSAEVSITQS